VKFINAGVYLNMFYGDGMTHTNHYQLKMYFICQSDTEMTPPVLEHIKTGYDAHIKILTKHACWKHYCTRIFVVFLRLWL